MLSARLIATLSPSRLVTSWITTVSVPDGITAPVKMRAASPGPIARSNGRPAATSPITRSTAGATTSSARTA